VTLKRCRRKFASLGYSSFDYAETLKAFGEHAEVFVDADGILVQQPGYARFIHYPRRAFTPHSGAGTPVPINAAFLFYIFLDAKSGDALLGDLQERYSLIHKTFGRRRANFWYWIQAVRSVGPIAWLWCKKALLKPAIGVMAWAVANGFVKHDSWLATLVEVWRKVRS
jgi:hypothetical protein